MMSNENIIVSNESHVDRFLDEKNARSIDRREFLNLSLSGILATTVPLIGFSDVAEAKGADAGRVSIQNYHTKEMFTGVYRVGDKYLPEAFDRLNYVLRDFRTNEAFPMDPRVIDIAAMVQKKLGYHAPIQILSGYRSPKTNNMLRRTSSGVARNSFHMYGQALDLRAPDSVGTRKLRNVAKSLQAGGVGYYPRSGFVHVGTGKVRTW